jgi:hypothetical protein
MNAKLLPVVLVLPFAATPAAAQCWGESEVFATDFVNFERFGEAAALEGDRAVFGAPGAFIQFTEYGEAFVFERTPGNTDWAAVATLQASNLTAVDEFGVAVSLSGDTAAVGAFMQFGDGAAYLFERDLGGVGAWGEAKKLTHPTGKSGTYFGQYLALDGDALVVSAPSDQGPGFVFGKVWVHARNVGGPNAWGQVKELKPVPPLGSNSGYGNAVAIDGERVAISMAESGSSGKVAIYERNAGGPGAWGQVALLTASNGSSSLGASLSLDGDRLAVGDWQDASLTGAAYLFERDAGGPGAWGEIARLEASDKDTGDRFGYSVCLDGDVLAVGAPYSDDDGDRSGSLYVFTRDLGGAAAWGELGKITTADAQSNDQLGLGVGLTGTTVASGSRHHDHPQPGMGAGYFFEANSVAPTPYCTAGPSASGCQAQLAYTGAPSATASSGFVLQATSVEGSKDGLFLYGTNGRQAVPWGNTGSYQCVVAPVRRGGLLSGTGTSGQCDGSFSQDLNARWCSTCPKPAHNPGPGSLLQVQLWYRDPQNPFNRTSSFSAALEFCVGL